MEIRSDADEALDSLRMSARRSRRRALPLGFLRKVRTRSRTLLAMPALGRLGRVGDDPGAVV